MTDINLDDHVLAAMRHPARIRMEVWARALDEHRRHQSFRVQQWPFSLEWGFTCECEGFEREWRIGISGLRSMLPEVRESIHRIFRLRLSAGNKKAKRVLRKANGRARALLHQHLTKEQRWELRATKAFTVRGQDGRTYSVTEGTAGNVFIIENGERTYRLCIVPNYKVSSMPMHDVLLAQKVLLENNIRLFLHTAHVTNLRTNMLLKNGSVLLTGLPEENVRSEAEVEHRIEINDEDIEEPEAWVLARLNTTTQGDEDGSTDAALRDAGRNVAVEPQAAE